MFNFLKRFLNAERHYKSMSLRNVAQTNPMYIPKRSMVIKNKIRRKRESK